jgi:hypothetical protein
VANFISSLPLFRGSQRAIIIGTQTVKVGVTMFQIHSVIKLAPSTCRSIIQTRGVTRKSHIVSGVARIHIPFAVCNLYISIFKNRVRSVVIQFILMIYWEFRCVEHCNLLYTVYSSEECHSSNLKHAYIKSYSLGFL